MKSRILYLVMVLIVASSLVLIGRQTGRFSLSGVRPNVLEGSILSSLGKPSHRDVDRLLYPEQQLIIHLQQDRVIAITGKTALQVDGKDLVKLGMSPEEVKLLLGTPITGFEGPRSLCEVYEDDDCELEVHYRIEAGADEFGVVLFRQVSEEWTTIMDDLPIPP